MDDIFSQFGDIFGGHFGGFGGFSGFGGGSRGGRRVNSWFGFACESKVEPERDRDRS